MNKSNKVLLGVLAFVVVCVIGYALFSETITVTGTATAKGNFEITTSEVDKDYANEFFMTWYAPEYENPIMSINDNEVSTSVTLKNPGATYTFSVKMENTGSIPARIKSIKDLTNNNIIFDRETDTYGNTFFFVGESSNTISAEMLFDGGYASDYADSPEDYTRVIEQVIDNDAFYNAVLDPGESVYFFFAYRWSELATKSEENLSITWNVQFNFEQVTVN